MTDIMASPLDGIDAAMAERLLAEALGSGGDYADLYFEYRVRRRLRASRKGGSARSGAASRWASACACCKGDATGYAYTEELSEERMREAARTAGQIAAGGGGARAGRHPAGRRCPTSTRSREPSLRAAGRGQARAAARAPTRRPAPTTRASCGSRPRCPRSGGRCWWSPPTGAGPRRPAADPLRRARGRRGRAASARAAARAAAAAAAWSTSRGPSQSPEEHGREAARLAIAMLDAREAPAGEMEVVLGPGDSGILLHEAVGHGLEADFNRKQTSNYTGQIGKPVASRAVHGGRRRHHRQRRAARSTSTTRATRAGATC